MTTAVALGSRSRARKNRISGLAPSPTDANGINSQAETKSNSLFLIGSISNYCL